MPWFLTFRLPRSPGLRVGAGVFVGALIGFAVGVAVGVGVGLSVGVAVAVAVAVAAAVESGLSIGPSSPTTFAVAVDTAAGAAAGAAATKLWAKVAPNATVVNTRRPAMANGSAAGRRRCETPRIGFSGWMKSSSILAPVLEDPCPGSCR